MPYVGSLAPLPGGQGTLTSDNNSARSRFLDLIVAEGVVSERGVWEREGGAAPYAFASFGTSLITVSFTARSIGAAAVFATFQISGSVTDLGQLAQFSALGSSDIKGLTAAVPSGAAILIAVSRVNGNGVGFSGVTDDAGNIYTLAGRRVFDNAVTELWAALNVTALTAGAAITATLPVGGPPGAGPYIAVGTIHVLGGLISSDQAVTASVGAGGTSLTQSSGFTLSAPNEVVLVAYGDADNVSAVTTSPPLTLASVGAFGIAAALFFGNIPFTAGVASANALSDYWPSSTVQRVLGLGSDGVAYKSSGGPFVALAMATVMQNQPGSMIVIGGQENYQSTGRKAFFFDGGFTKIQTLIADGVTTTNFGNDWNTTTNIPLDWATNPPRGATVHKERLWPFAPSNAPHNIYASTTTDHEQFKNAVGGQFEYVQAIGTGTGQRIVAAASFKGMLFAFKFPRGIYFLDDTDVDYLNWRWNLVSDAIGAADSPYSVVVLDDDVLFVDANGHLNFLSAVTQGGVASQDLTAALNLQQWTRDNINLNRLSAMSSVYYPAKKLAMIGLSSPTSTSNDLRMYLDFSSATQEGQTVRISYSHRDVNRVLAIWRDTSDGVQRPLMADDSSGVWKLDQASKVKVGVPNAGQARYQYSPTDFSHLDPTLANKRKLFDALTITFNPTGTWNLGVDTIIDGEYHETLYFSMGGANSVLGTFVFGGKLGGGAITTNRRRMTGNGYWLSIAGWVQGDGFDFSVVNHFVNYRTGGEEQR